MYPLVVAGLVKEVLVVALFVKASPVVAKLVKALPAGGIDTSCGYQQRSHVQATYQHRWQQQVLLRPIKTTLCTPQLTMNPLRAVQDTLKQRPAVQMLVNQNHAPHMPAHLL